MRGTPGREPHMKRSRDMVPIEGQHVLLQNSLSIKMFSFFLNSQNYRMNHIFLEIFLNIFKKKTLERRPQSRKNAQ